MENTKNSPLWLLAIMVIPFIYLGFVWSDIPETVATHFDYKGNADGFGSKQTLIYLPLLLMVPTFLILQFAPKLDPKKKMKAMGSNYQKFQVVMMTFLAGISLFLIHVAASDGSPKVNLLYALIGLFYMAFGNYLPTVKPNYFIGIRSPWTLESETVWRKTHRIGGKTFMIGGFAIALLSLLTNAEMAFGIMMGSSIAMTVGLMIYSYLEYKKLE